MFKNLLDKISIVGYDNFPFLDGDVPRRTSFGVLNYQLIRFARASSNLSDFNCRNKAFTAKLLRIGYLYYKLRKAFSKFYRRHSALIEKIVSALRNFCNKLYRNQNFTVAWFIELEKKCWEI